MTPRQAALLRLLQRNPDGLGLIDLIATTGGTHYGVSYDLRTLRENGRAGPSDAGGAGVLWAATEDLAALKARRKAARDAASAAAKKRAAQREATAQERAAEEAAVEAFCRPPVHLVLAQADWLGCAPARGVVSVFDLGAAHG